MYSELRRTLSSAAPAIIQSIGTHCGKGLGKYFRVVERKCLGRGDSFCEFEVNPQDPNRTSSSI